MPLQTNRLVMTGLGILNDAPAVDLQPPLPDGVHLRWAFQREVGFPWHGYYLFRRPHEKRGQHCVANSFTLRPVGTLGTSHWAISEGIFRSDTDLVLTYDTGQIGTVGLDLAGREYLQFDMPATDTAFYVDVTVAFREPTSGDNGQGIIVTGFDADMPVVSEELVHTNGHTASASLWFDRITSLRITPGDGALIELCWHPISEGADNDWKPVPDCPQPLTLPISHPDYPANSGPIDVTAAWGTAKARITYGLPDRWERTPFISLHEQLKALVVGGPPGRPELAMAHPARAHRGLKGIETSAASGEQPPSIREVHPLDLVVLGAIHPAIAQMAGIYWTDTTTNTTDAYDYLVIADQDGVANGQAEKMLSHIRQGGFEKVDAWITFNNRMTPAAPLDPPKQVQAYALPGGTYRGADVKVHDAKGNVGITWQIEHSEQGYLRPRHPVMYHVWRDRQGNGNTPVANAEATKLVTLGRPLLLVNPPGIVDRPVLYPTDWPPFPLHCIDFALAEGWYGYQVNAIDLFGRFSPKSSFAEWRQWDPPPQPRPWYYQDPPAGPVVNPSSIRILDKFAPPPPLAVEAYVLDPDDPLLVRDQKYVEWLNNVSAPIIGLRVRWWWTAAQQRQAPDIVEFRIYWNAGSAMPTNWRDVATWQLRCYVCPFGQNVRVLDHDEIAELEQNEQKIQTVVHRAGDRRYEVFLPTTGMTGPLTNGVPLVPTLTDPIAYANVTVSAADGTPHSPDRWPDAGGLFAGRNGNESQAAAPQRVYRVWRQPPEPPPYMPGPDRHYATAADYHGRSYFTYRWQPQADLRVHVYRALDDSVFKLDWSIRDQRGAIDLNKPEHQAYFPGDYPADRCAAAAAELNALDSPVAYRSLSDDALRVLANLPGNEKAFSQLTTTPQANSISSFPDTLDGRATNCYFYRVAYVDKAQNRSALSLASAPVFLPDVTPPKAPVITKVVGGDREITLVWASNRELDLAEYHVYRADSAEAARDVRLMKQVGTLKVITTPAARPAAVQWTDKPVPGLKEFWYCVVAVDRINTVNPLAGGGNISQPSVMMKARAVCLAPPKPPSWISGMWESVSSKPGIRLAWSSSEPYIQAILQRRRLGTTLWVAVAHHLQPDSTGLSFEYIDFSLDPHKSYEYQLFAADCGGNRSVESDVMIVAAS